ncbi:hypothetical protein BU52_28525 [Streptomyces toyocaensis]|uniref:Uncharacterized protein n=1 Tax=Streptomyces toyocaensis TaxID=55952 RepID=A0A081XJR2_STRTO|nr:hypothetical protein BU52_28525 [Streptomyces toyocaensis]
MRFLDAKISHYISTVCPVSWTSEIGVETSGDVPPKSIVYGDYGIMKEKVYGYKYHRGSACQKSHKQYMTVWAPYREGWRIR